MPKFKIEYVDPETEETKVVIKTFEDTPSARVLNETLGIDYTTSISARKWANDYAYMLADKGSYNIEEI